MAVRLATQKSNFTSTTFEQKSGCFFFIDSIKILQKSKFLHRNPGRVFINIKTNPTNTTFEL